MVFQAALQCLGSYAQAALDHIHIMHMGPWATLASLSFFTAALMGGDVLALRGALLMAYIFNLLNGLTGVPTWPYIDWRGRLNVSWFDEPELLTAHCQHDQPACHMLPITCGDVFTVSSLMHALSAFTACTEAAVHMRDISTNKNVFMYFQVDMVLWAVAAGCLHGCSVLRMLMDEMPVK